MESSSFKITPHPTPFLSSHSCSIKRAPCLLSPISYHHFPPLLVPLQTPRKMLLKPRSLQHILLAPDFGLGSLSLHTAFIMGMGSVEKRISPGQEGDLEQMNSSFWICFFLSLLSFSWLKHLQDCLLSQVLIFLMAFTGTLQAEFNLFDLISHYYSWAHTLHSLPITQQSSFGSPYGLPIQLQFSSR